MSHVNRFTSMWSFLKTLKDVTLNMQILLNSEKSHVKDQSLRTFQMVSTQL